MGIIYEKRNIDTDIYCGSGILTDVLNVSIFTAHHRRIVVARRNRRLLLQLLALGGFTSLKTTLSCFELATQRAPLVGL